LLGALMSTSILYLDYYYKYSICSLFLPIYGLDWHQ